MPGNAEIAKDTIEQFKKVQRYMIAAKKEDAKETYKILKEEYREDGIYVEALMPKQY